MLKLVSLANIPEWSICYLVNGDSEGLSEDEIKEADDYYEKLLKTYKARRIMFGTDIMNEELYGNYYRNEFGDYSDFGKRFEACISWQLPIYADIEEEEQTRYHIIIRGVDWENKDRVIIIKDKTFVDSMEAELWAYFYHAYMLRSSSIEIDVIESKECIIEIMEGF